MARSALAAVLIAGATSACGLLGGDDDPDREGAQIVLDAGRDLVADVESWQADELSDFEVRESTISYSRTIGSAADLLTASSEPSGDPDLSLAVSDAMRQCADLASGTRFASRDAEVFERSVPGALTECSSALDALAAELG